MTNSIQSSEQSSQSATSQPPVVQSTSLNAEQQTIHQISKHEATQLIGTILVESNKLDMDKVEPILNRAQRKNVRFGEAAIQLGLLKEEDVRYALAQQYNYPYLLKGDGTASDALVAAYQPFSKQVEGLRALRSQLTLRWFTTWPLRKTLSIVSSGRGEGRSYLTANLAVMFSQLGKRTLIVDADMRKPSQHIIFNMPNQIGLSSILSNRGDASSIQSVPSLPDLFLLTGGPTPPNAQELLGRPLFKSLTSYVSNEFDIVLIDTPAANQYADAKTIAIHGSGALVVTRQNTSHLYDTKQLTDDLAELKVTVVGAVLNHF